MCSRQERQLLEQKLREINQAIAQTQARFDALAPREETAQLRETVSKLLTELRRMEKNLQALLRLNDDMNAQGGTNHGDH